MYVKHFTFLPFQYNDNNGNPYSDVYWLAALVQSIGELEFGQQVCLVIIIASSISVSFPFFHILACFL